MAAGNEEDGVAARDREGFAYVQHRQHNRGRMHPLNPYQSMGALDFADLVACYPPLAAVVCRWRPGGSAPILNWGDPRTNRLLTEALLLRHFDLAVSLREGRLAPAVPNRVNYLCWLKSVLGASGRGGHRASSAPVRVLDVGVGSSCIYPLLGQRMFGWSFLGSDIDAEAVRDASEHVRRNRISDAMDLSDVRSSDDGEGQQDSIRGEYAPGEGESDALATHLLKMQTEHRPTSGIEVVCVPSSEMLQRLIEPLLVLERSRRLSRNALVHGPGRAPVRSCVRQNELDSDGSNDAEDDEPSRARVRALDSISSSGSTTYGGAFSDSTGRQSTAVRNVAAYDCAATLQLLLEPLDDLLYRDIDAYVQQSHEAPSPSITRWVVLNCLAASYVAQSDGDRDTNCSRSDHGCAFRGPIRHAVASAAGKVVELGHTSGGGKGDGGNDASHPPGSTTNRDSACSPSRESCAEVLAVKEEERRVELASLGYGWLLQPGVALIVLERCCRATDDESSLVLESREPSPSCGHTPPKCIARVGRDEIPSIVANAVHCLAPSSSSLLASHPRDDTVLFDAVMTNPPFYDRNEYIAPSPQYSSMWSRDLDTTSPEAHASTGGGQSGHVAAATVDAYDKPQHAEAERCVERVPVASDTYVPSSLLPGVSDELRTCGGELAFAVAMLLDAQVMKDSVVWYSSMFGRRGSAKAFLRLVSQLPFIELGNNVSVSSGIAPPHSEAAAVGYSSRLAFGVDSRATSRSVPRTVLSTRFFQGGFSSTDAAMGAASVPEEAILDRDSRDQDSSEEVGMEPSGVKRANAGTSSGTVRWAVAWSYRSGLDAQAVAKVEERVFASSASRKRKRGAPATTSMPSASSASTPRPQLHAAPVPTAVSKSAICMSWSEFQLTSMAQMESLSQYRGMIRCRIDGSLDGGTSADETVDGAARDPPCGDLEKMCGAVRRAVLAVESAVMSSLGMGARYDDSNCSTKAEGVETSPRSELQYYAVFSCNSCRSIVGVLEPLNPRRISSGAEHMAIREMTMSTLADGEPRVGICGVCCAGKEGMVQAIRVTFLQRAQSDATLAGRQDLLLYEVGFRLAVESSRLRGSQFGALEDTVVRLEVLEFNDNIGPDSSNKLRRSSGSLYVCPAQPGASVDSSASPRLYYGDVSWDRSSSVVRLNPPPVVRRLFASVREKVIVAFARQNRVWRRQLASSMSDIATATKKKKVEGAGCEGSFDCAAQN